MTMRPFPPPKPVRPPLPATLVALVALGGLPTTSIGASERAAGVGPPVPSADGATLVDDLERLRAVTRMLRAEAPPEERFAESQTLAQSCASIDLDCAEAAAPRVGHVAPWGDDEAGGGEQDPWRTVAHGVSALARGGVLHLRGGTYRESEIRVKRAEDAVGPLVIRAYPGEVPVIDASVIVSGSQDDHGWELFDEASATWRRRVPESTHPFFGRAILPEASVPLIVYSERRDQGASGLEDLISPIRVVSRHPRYVGPGLYGDGAGWLYARLQPPAARGEGGLAWTRSLPEDPNEVTIAVADTYRAFRIEGSGVVLSGLRVAGALIGVDLDDGVSRVLVHDSTIVDSALGISLGDGVGDVHVRNVEFVGARPPWLAWTDMKGGDGQARPAVDWPNRSAGISGGTVTGLEVTGSLFSDVFDGMVVDGRDIVVRGNHGVFADDMVQLGSNSSDVEIAYNAVIGAGIAHDGRADAGAGGPTYVHHNVIDARVRFLWSRSDPDGLLRTSYVGWQAANPFPAHSRSRLVDGDPWKLYHNTVLFDSTDRGIGAAFGLWNNVNRTGDVHTVVNNIFVNVGDGRFAGKLDLAVEGQVHDANTYFRAGPEGWLYTGRDPAGEPFQARTLDEWARLRHGYDGAIGEWDLLSGEADPQLDRHYRPRAPLATLGPVAPLPDDWPGAPSRVRGALSPATRTANP